MALNAVLLSVFIMVLSTVCDSTNLPGYDVDANALYNESELMVDVTYQASGQTFNKPYPYKVDGVFDKAFLTENGTTLAVGDMNSKCPNCYREPMNYTFAAWINLKPFRISENWTIGDCSPISGPVLMRFGISDKDNCVDARFRAKTGASNVLAMRSKMVNSLANIWTWNHFAIVVEAGNMTVYCNGYPCFDTSEQIENKNDVDDMIKLNINRDKGDRCDVAFDKIALWDRPLSQKEIQGLRLAPIMSLYTTTMPPTTRTQKSGGGGGSTVDKHTTSLSTEDMTTTATPTKKPDDQLNDILKQFNFSSGANTSVSSGAISSGALAATSVLDNILNPVGNDDNNSSYNEVPVEQKTAVLKVSASLFEQMAAAGLQAPVDDGSAESRVNLLKFFNSIVDLDVKISKEGQTNLDGASLVQNIEALLQSFFREPNPPARRSTEAFDHIDAYEMFGLERLGTPVSIVFAESSGKTDVFTEVPAEIIKGHRNVKLAAAAIYNAVQLGMPRKMKPKTSDGEGNSETVEVISPIISLQVNFNASKLKTNISFVYNHREKRKGEVTICGFLKFGENTEWANEGCWDTEVNNTFTICHCNHLTNFALLMATDGLVLNTWHSKAATFLTYATVSISILCLIISLVVLFVHRKTLKNKRFRILRNTCLSMLLAHLLFLFSDIALQNKSACTVIAALLHYLFLTVFCWMFIMGFQIYTKVRRATKTQVDFLYYLIFGWGFPLGIVGLCVGTNTDGYGVEDVACWLNPKDNTIWAFVGPALGILFFNIIVMILVMRAFVNVKVNKDKDALDQLRAAAKAVIVMLPVLGLTWILGLVVQYHLVFLYLFIFLNGLQGFLLFMLHIVFNKEVQNAVSGKNKVNATPGTLTAAAFGKSTETDDIAGPSSGSG